MKTMDTIIIGAIVMMLSFPLMWLGGLLLTGNAKLIFKGDLARMVEIETTARMQRNNLTMDSLIIANTEAFQSNVLLKNSIANKSEEIDRDQERLDVLKSELQTERANIEAAKAGLDKAISDLADERAKYEETMNGPNDGAIDKATVSLAKTYQAMKPAEAAQIMETLPDNLCVDILKSMTDDRQKGRILSSMDTEKAAKLSKLMSAKKYSRVN
ncbi:MAG: hypothetical protein FWF51_02570 [Chitinivibrionia bacterium]|nr:hypothetical protein [Chitinivibrionia bacterium]